MHDSKPTSLILAVKYFLVHGIILSAISNASPINNNEQHLLKRKDTRDSKNQTPAEDRFVPFAPPTFPYWGPFGFTSTAILCPWFVGPYAGSWNRACAGPVPPFKRTTTTTTTTTTPSPNTPKATDMSNNNDTNKYKNNNNYYYLNEQPNYSGYNNNNYYNNNNNYAPAPYGYGGVPAYTRRQQQQQNKSIRLPVSKSLPRMPNAAAAVAFRTQEFLNDGD